MITKLPLTLLFLFVVSRATFAQKSGSELDRWKGFLVQEIAAISNNSPKTLKELEIVDEQIQKIKEIATAQAKGNISISNTYRKLFAEITAEFNSPGYKKKSSELKSKMVKELNDLATQSMKELEKVILPHQMKRIEQIARQKQLTQRSNGDKIWMYRDLAEKIGMERNDIVTLTKNLATIRKEYLEDIKKASEKAEKKILKQFTAEQRAEIKKLIGDLFLK